jgi:hypothetical protein
MPMRTLFLTWLAVCAVSAAIAEDKPEPAKPASRTVRQIEGWTVRIDNRLLTGSDEVLGSRAIALLTAKLAEIRMSVNAARVVELQRVPIVLDLTHGKLTSMQYHPSAKWLEDNGYSRELAKCVHIPVAARFASAKHNHIQPWCMLHELAHAFHDQVLGFEHPRVKEVWQRYVDSGHGVRALHVDGRTVRHYAMTNEKEFFAEMSEAYFGTNDFFPFVNGELKQAEPEVHALLREIWGEVASEQ